MNIHQHPRQSVRMAWIVLLALSYVDETLGEPVAVVGVVSAAAPHPVVDAARLPLVHAGSDGNRSRTATTAARRQLGVAATSTDGVHDSCRRHSVNQRCLTASCAQTNYCGELAPSKGNCNTICLIFQQKMLNCLAEYSCSTMSNNSSWFPGSG